MAIKQHNNRSPFGKAIDFFMGYDTNIRRSVNDRLSGNDLVNANLYPYLAADTNITPGDNFNYIKDGYMASAPMYECIDLIMKKILACPVLIYRVKSEQKMKVYEGLMKSPNLADNIRAKQMKAEVFEEVDEPRLRRLIEKPNDTQTWDEFISLITVLYLATGNAFVYGNASDKRSKKWTEIFALPFSPLEMNIVSGGWDQPVKSYTALYNNKQSTIDFEAWQIEHIKTVNPLYRTTGQQNYGMAPMHAYTIKLYRDKFGEEAANKILAAGAPFGFLTPKQPQDELTSSQKTAWTEKIRDIILSRRPESRYVPGSVPLEWVPIGFPSSELQLFENSKDVRESIYRGFHVPLVYASNDSSTYNNSKEAKRSLVFDAILPVARAIYAQLTAFITAGYSEKYVIMPDIMSLPEMATDMKELVEWADKSPITIDEFRAALGYSELKSADSSVVMMNRNKVPLNLVVSGAAISGAGSRNNEEGA